MRLILEIWRYLVKSPKGHTLSFIVFTTASRLSCTISRKYHHVKSDIAFVRYHFSRVHATVTVARVNETWELMYEDVFIVIHGLVISCQIWNNKFTAMKNCLYAHTLSFISCYFHTELVFRGLVLRGQKNTDKVVSAECKLYHLNETITNSLQHALMISKYLFSQWLGAVSHQAMNWSNVLRFLGSIHTCVITSGKCGNNFLCRILLSKQLST